MRFADFFLPWQWQVLSQAAQITKVQGGQLYAVGGVVRDYLLGNRTPPIDIDLVVEGSGVEVAAALQKEYPQARVQLHPKFLTAEVFFPECTIDIATARREYYAYPGANPQVTPCALFEDLDRRDFTINALAIPIHATPETSDIIDRFQGRADLVQKQIRPIRSGSFLEDPRRIFRAVRFAVKLGFHLAPETSQEIQETIASGVHEGLGGSRLRAELLYLLHPTFFPKRSTAMLLELDRWQAWRCLHPDLSIPQDIGLQLRRLQRWHRYFLGDASLPSLAIACVLKKISPQDLQSKELLSGESLQHLQHLGKLSAIAANVRENGTPASQIVAQLQSLTIGSILLSATSCESAFRHLLWRYLIYWRSLPPLLTGTDLKCLGCSEGKQIGLWLKQIRSLQLDGVLSTAEEAEAMVRQWMSTDPECGVQAEKVR